MNKFIAATAGAISTLGIAAPAFAQLGGQSVSPCPSGLGTLCNLNADQFGSIISTAVNVIIVVAIIIAVFFLVWGGVKWITSGGDKGKVETARNTIIAGIIGLVFVFLAYFLISLVANIFGINIGNLSLPQVGL